MQQPLQQSAAVTGAAGAGATGHHDADERVMDLLHEHVPLSLLVDLAEPGDVDSRAILATEGQPDDPWWEPEAL